MLVAVGPVFGTLWYPNILDFLVQTVHMNLITLEYQRGKFSNALLCLRHKCCRQIISQLMMSQY